MTLMDNLWAKRSVTFKKLTILELQNRSLLLYDNNRVFIPTAVPK